MLGDVNKLFVFKSLLLLPQVNFAPQNLNFHWRWRWWDQIQAIFLNLIYFTLHCIEQEYWSVLLIILSCQYMSYLNVKFNSSLRRINVTLNINAWEINCVHFYVSGTVLRAATSTSGFWQSWNPQCSNFEGALSFSIFTSHPNALSSHPR